MAVPSEHLSEMDNGPASCPGGNGEGINNVNPYKLVDDAYSGQGGFRSGEYLIKHDRERDFKERQSYSYYLNYFKPISDSLINPVFKRPPEREYNSTLYGTFIEDVDRNKNDLTQFMVKVAKKALRHGATFIVMDTPSDQPATEAKMLEDRSFPYIYVKTAPEVVLWEITRFGDLISITFVEATDKIEKGKKPGKQYRKWEKGKWTLYEKLTKEGELKKEIKTGDTKGVLSVIPVFMTEQNELTYLPVPGLYDLAKINAAIYNISSEIREIQRKQGFSILAVPKNGNKSTSSEIGTTSAFNFPHDAKHTPHFITSDTAIQIALQEERAKLVEEMYKQAKLAGVTGIIQQSGIAKQWDFEATDTELRFHARVIEDAERNLIALFGSWTGKPEIKYERVGYPEDFGILDTADKLTEAEGIAGLDMPESVVTESKVAVVNAVFKDLEQKNRDELIKDVRDEGEAAEQAKQNDGKPGEGDDEGNAGE